ncbi:MAG: diphthamide synthesis protein [Nanoarchaeota archaeon]
MKSLGELDKKYDLELDKVVKKIKSSKAKLVLLQFPDGLKPYATAVVDFLEENTDAEFIIWMESCYGACDTPTGINNLGVDLVVQFGHSGKMPGY